MPDLQLGKLESVHAVAPAYVQRAVFVAVASFICFLAMMAGFYIRQNIGYFLLSTAFLIVYILTMIGILAMKRNVFNIYHNGLSYRKFTARWEEISSAVLVADKQKKHAEITKSTGEKIVVSDAVEGLEQIVALVRQKIDR